jgi:hypothetical protein
MSNYVWKQQTANTDVSGKNEAYIERHIDFDRLRNKFTAVFNNHDKRFFIHQKMN